MTKPVYRYPEFVNSITLNATKDKRYWLRLGIDKNKEEDIVVILKNPSRANDKVSDKTVFNVCNYIYRNQKTYSALKNIRSIIILNLIPYYQTDSKKLQSWKEVVIDFQNLETIKSFTTECDKIIIAWGNHPKGLYDEYLFLKSKVIKIITRNKKEIFYVDRITIKGNPKHGQVWGYNNQLIRLYTIALFFFGISG